MKQKYILKVKKDWNKIYNWVMFTVTKCTLQLFGKYLSEMRQIIPLCLHSNFKKI
jgi:hypothetical protein